VAEIPQPDPHKGNDWPQPGPERPPLPAEPEIRPQSPGPEITPPAGDDIMPPGPDIVPTPDVPSGPAGIVSAALPAGS
jgi:hypothetical protein